MRSRLFWLARFGFLLAAGLATAVAGSAWQAPSGGGPDAEQVIRARVQQFYSFLQLRQIPQAEAFVTKETQGRLKDQASNPFLGFRIISVDVSPGATTAAVIVELTVMAPYMGAPSPMQRNSQWRMEDGEWRIVVPEVPPAASMESMMGIAPLEPAKPEELKFKGHSFGLGIMKPGEVKAARFPFTNITDHAVKITQVATGCACLKVKTEKMEYQPGESGELVIEFDSTGYRIEYLQSVVVRTNPGDVKSYLRIAATIDTPPQVMANPPADPSGPPLPLPVTPK